MVVGSRKERSLKRSLGRQAQGRVSAEATRSGSSRWARLLCAADAAAARAHAPGQAGPRERGGYAVRATRYGKPASRLGGPPPGPGYWLARRGGRVTLVRPPVLRVAFPPGGGLGGQRRRCDRHQGTGRAIVQEDTRTLTRERDSIDTHTTSSSTQPVNHTQNRNTRTHPRQTSRLHAHTHLPNTSRSENDANQQTTHRPANGPNAPHHSLSHTQTLSHPHARARPPGEPSPARAPPTPPPAPRPPAASPAAAPAAPAQPRRAGGG